MSGKDSIEVEILTENPSVTTTIVSRAPQVEVDMDMPAVKVPRIEKTTEILKGDNNGNAVAATPNEDYQTPLTAGTDYQTPLPSQSGNNGKFLKTDGSTMSWGAAYVKPANGIPKSDLDNGVQASLGKADTALQSAPVTSVNSNTGDVVITAADLGAYEKPSTGIPASDLSSAVQTSLGKADTALQSAPVTSVNSDTGDVVITAADLGAYEKPSTGIPLADLSSGVQTSLGKADTALQSAPVTSVNSATGDVVITAAGLGAYVKPSDGIPSSDLSSGVQSSLNKADTALQSAPVTSVNTQTGDVVITAAGLGAYEKPSGGIPASDLDSSVQTSLGKADTALQSAPVTSVNNDTGDVVITAAGLGAYEKPAGGIPATDLANTYAASHTANGAAELTVAIPYGEVDSTSVNTAFTATVAGIYELKKGVVCYIRNDVVSGTTNCTLNINGLGAKPIYASNADTSRVTSGFSAATTWLLVYNEARVTGGCWDAYYGSVNSNTIGYQVRTNSSRLPVKTYCGRYRLLFTAPDGMNYVPANADTQTSASKTHTVTTEPIDPFGTIRYYGSTSILQADALPAATVLWQQYVVTLGYSFNNANAALALTVNTPVYIKCRPNADGSANIDTTTPYVQALPTTEDGYIYIFLGICDAATTVEMQVTHPIYQYKSGKICLYTGA